MTKKNKIWVVVAVAIIILVGIGGRNPETKTEKPVQEQVKQEEQKNVKVVPTVKPIWDETEAKGLFMEGCTESGEVSWKMCNCMYTEIRKDYSTLEMAAMGQMEDVEVAEMMASYVYACLD